MCLAIPGELIAIDDQNDGFPTGTVSLGGVRREVSLACLPGATLGDFVLVHAGIAISILDPAEAERVFTYLDELGALK